MEVTKKELKEEYDRRWAAGGLAFLAAFSDITHNLDANKTATQYIEDKIDEIVKNKKISEALKPRSIVGCKRLVIESNYFDTFNRGNVELINLKKKPN